MYCHSLISVGSDTSKFCVSGWQLTEAARLVAPGDAETHVLRLWTCSVEQRLCGITSPARLARFSLFCRTPHALQRFFSPSISFARHRGVSVVPHMMQAYSMHVY